MTIEGTGLSLIQRIDIHDMKSLFTLSRVTLSLNTGPVILQSRFAFVSMSAVSMIYTPLVSRSKVDFRLASSLTINSEFHARGSRIESLAASFAINSRTRALFQINWIKINNEMAGALLSSPYDAETGNFVSYAADGYKFGDTLAVISQEDFDLATGDQFNEFEQPLSDKILASAGGYRITTELD